MTQSNNSPEPSAVGVGAHPVPAKGLIFGASANTIRRFSLVCTFAALLLLNGGCTSENVLYNKDRRVVAGVWEGAFIDGKGEVPCHGSIEVNRTHDFFHDDFYGFSFKNTVASPGDFFFTMAKDYNYNQLPLKIIEARGVVKLTGERQVFFDVEYRDSGGNWTKLPFNGRHKIDQVWPDDLPRTNNISL
jgi:hypothetical protein